MRSSHIRQEGGFVSEDASKPECTAVSVVFRYDNGAKVVYELRDMVRANIELDEAEPPNPNADVRLLGRLHDSHKVEAGE